MKTNRTVDLAVLRTFESFSRIPAQSLRKLVREMSIFKMPARKTTSIRDDDVNQAYLVLQGAVKVDHVSHFLATILAPGELFGLCNLIPNGPRLLRYHAIRDSVVARIPADRFANIALGVPLPTFAKFVDFVVGSWWAGLVARQTFLARLPLGLRLSRILLDMGSKFGLQDSRGILLNLPLTQKDLAELIGSSRPQVNILLARLSGSGAVLRDGRRLILVKPRLEEEVFKLIS